MLPCKNLSRKVCIAKLQTRNTFCGICPTMTELLWSNDKIGVTFIADLFIVHAKHILGTESSLWQVYVPGGRLISHSRQSWRLEVGVVLGLLLWVFTSVPILVNIDQECDPKSAHTRIYKYTDTINDTQRRKPCYML